MFDMNDSDRKAFEAAYEAYQNSFGCVSTEHRPFLEGWQAALAHARQQDSALLDDCLAYLIFRRDGTMTRQFPSTDDLIARIEGGK